MNINVEAIKEEIARLKGLTAEEYCKEEVEKIYANFEELRTDEISKLETALDVADRFQVREETEQVAEEATENTEG